VSSGGFSCAVFLGSTDDSDAVDAAVDTGESSKEPDEVEVMAGIWVGKMTGQIPL